MNSRRRGFVVTIVAMILAGVAADARCDDFTNARLAAGMEAYRSRRFAEASDQLRIACFGLLDQPALLSENLVWLAFAQEAAGARTDAQNTLVRFLDVERRFAVYAKTGLDAPTRAEFEKFLRSRVSSDAIDSVPSLGGPPGKAAAPGTSTRKAP